MFGEDAGRSLREWTSILVDDAGRSTETVRGSKHPPSHQNADDGFEFTTGRVVNCHEPLPSRRKYASSSAPPQRRVGDEKDPYPPPPQQQQRVQEVKCHHDPSEVEFRNRQLRELYGGKATGVKCGDPRVTKASTEPRGKREHILTRE